MLGTCYRAQCDVADNSEGGITATDHALDQCVSESHGSRCKAVGNARVNSVVIVYNTASTSPSLSPVCC